MSREQLQRLALVTIVVLLAALASERLMAMIRPSCHTERFVHVRVHEGPPRIEVHGLAEAHEMAAHARHMGEEARRMAEEHRRIAGEHRHLLEERRAMEREIEREVRRELESTVVVR